MNIDTLIFDESIRQAAFPVCQDGAYFAHAGVAPLPAAAAHAIQNFLDQATRGNQESVQAMAAVDSARVLGARLIGAQPEEISLLGPTALGLSLVARGLHWNTGDEVVFNGDDYPANVYPWRSLESCGVKPVALFPQQPGVIAWENLEPLLTERTRLVSLASCHFISGYRIDVDGIGRRLQARNIRFCVDAIQTLGAFPFSTEHVDFLSADSHKWMLGPAGAGIFFVKASRREELAPALLGSWNVVSPNFVAQTALHYEAGGRRYEPGMLNLPGIAGMEASLRLLLDLGIAPIAERLLHLRRYTLKHARAMGYRLCLEDWDQSDAASDDARSAIMAFTHPTRDLTADFQALAAKRMVTSLRKDRAGTAYLRIAPHFYNTEAEIDRLFEVLAG
ncbi:MAG: aminotransferase class V-fold PLP-dependent enzyme [Candidatus Hydrogenedentes bacterium]|nr:aminotransferase class V-fold PLP-dependent enzyme [Candidatus Hydrogenedentota bacterium]